MDREDEEQTTRELRIEQADREREEQRRLEESGLPAEAKQHEWRAEKAAYLKEKPAERGRAEREG